MSARSVQGSLPARPHRDWYRKAAKKKLAELRAHDGGATLALAQFALAREHGYASWRALMDAVDAQRGREISSELFAAIRARDHHRIRVMLAARPALVDTATPRGTPLHAAAEANDPEAIGILLSHGADPERRYTQFGHTALSWAVTTGCLDAASALARAGARSDLYCAATLGDLAAVRAFFADDGTLRPEAAHTCSVRFLPATLRIPGPGVATDLSSDALYAAVRYARLEVARFLIARGANVNARFIGATLLHWADYAGSTEVAQLLVAAGADRHARDDSFGCTPRAFGICVAARLGRLPVVMERLEADPSLARINEGRGTPLHEAARAGHDEIVRVLLEHGADPGARDTEWKTPADLTDRATTLLLLHGGFQPWDEAAGGLSGDSLNTSHR
jgi:protein DGCR14